MLVCAGGVFFCASTVLVCASTVLVCAGIFFFVFFSASTRNQHIFGDDSMYVQW
jgi:hypothetical protein